MPYMAGVVLSALARSALGAATPALAAADACAEDNLVGIGNHILPSGLVCRNLETCGTYGPYGLAWSSLDSGTSRDAGTVSATASNPQPHWWWALLVQHAFRHGQFRNGSKP